MKIGTLQNHSLPIFILFQFENSVFCFKVEDVDRKFKDLNKLKENNWVAKAVVSPPKRKVLKVVLLMALLKL